MKLFTKNPHLVLAAALLGLPLVAFGTDEKALMEPESVLDHYLMIQTELSKDSLKGVDEHANGYREKSERRRDENAFARSRQAGGDFGQGKRFEGRSRGV